MNEAMKPVRWMGRSKDSLKEFPETVQKAVGTALRLAQQGQKSSDAKPLKGFGGAGVLEIVEDFHSDTYRCVYTVKFAAAVYVLHVFQKKSTRGIKTPQHEIEKIKERLKRAMAEYREEFGT